MREKISDASIPYADGPKPGSQDICNFCLNSVGPIERNYAMDNACRVVNRGIDPGIRFVTHEATGQTEVECDSFVEGQHWGSPYT